MDNQRGFSLTETIVCLAIVAVLACFSYPAVEGWKKNAEMRKEVYAFVSILNKAKIEAIRTNSFAVVEMQQSGCKVFIDDGAGGGIAEDWVQQPGERSVASIQLPANITLESNFSHDRTRFTGRFGVVAGHMVLVQKNRQKMKIVINVIGRIRTERM